MTVDFCLEALEEAIAKYGRPQIFNTDQGSQFTSDEFTLFVRAGVGQPLTIAPFNDRYLERGA